MTLDLPNKPESIDREGGGRESVGSHMKPPAAPAPEQKLKGNLDETIGFLRWLPHEFHTLTAIHINPKTREKGLIETRSFPPQAWLAIRKWVEPRLGVANIYWLVNPLRAAKDSKATKAEIASYALAQVDIDCPAGEDQAEFVERIIAKIPSLRLEPSIVINSGGGIQIFYLWQDPVELNGDPAAIAAAEALTRGVEDEVSRALGVEVDSTFNCDRIMRLPGTINIPDSKKIARGRKSALAKVVHMSDLRYPRSAFAPAAAPSGNGLQPVAKVVSLNEFRSSRGTDREMHVNFEEAQRLYRSEAVTLAALERRGVAEHVIKDLREGGSDDRSERLASIARGLLAAGLSPEEAGAVMMDDAYPGNAHATEMKAGQRNRAIRRALGAASKSLEGERRRAEADKRGLPRWKETYDEAGLFPMPTHRNAKIAVDALHIKCRYNEFKQQIELSYAGESVVLQEIAAGSFNERVTHRIRDVIEARFDFDPTEKHVHDALHSLAYADSYNPVVQYLDDCQARWDGEPRLATFCSVYFGVEDTPYNVEVIRAMLLGSVARARRPGCKFDTASVLEGEEGIGKSSFVEIMYGSDNYSDEPILGSDGRMVQELVAGVWGYEISELAGMTRAEIEQTKNFISKTHDRARGAYARNKANQPRSNVFWGTTNHSEYLLSQTGNRRWLPIFLGKNHIDLAALKRDRDQIWGEASARLAKGESYMLKREFRTISKAAQEQRLVIDPWEDRLLNIPAAQIQSTPDGMQRVPTSTLLGEVLNIPVAQQTGSHSRRLALVMRRLGWERGVWRNGERTYRGWVRPNTAQPAAKDQDQIPF